MPATTASFPGLPQLRALPATDLLRLDHLHVLTAFRQFDADATPRFRKGLADHIGLALEIHALLEEEIFYPALAAVWDHEAMRDSRHAHDEMRALVTRVRHLPATDPLFEANFLELMRQVMHHVADEEALALPAAERLLAGRLQELGARMTRRRLELAALRTPQLASSVLRSLSPGTMLAAGTVAMAGARMVLRGQHGPTVRTTA